MIKLTLPVLGKPRLRLTARFSTTIFRTPKSFQRPTTCKNSMPNTRRSPPLIFGEGLMKFFPIAKPPARFWMKCWARAR